MAKSLAVLQWRDIQVLVKLCSQSVSQQEKQWQELELVRHELIEALLEYLPEWLPGREMENHRRRKLIKALGAFSVALESGNDVPCMLDDKGKDSSSLIHDECCRISQLLIGAIELTGEKVDGDSIGTVGRLQAIVFPLFCLASQLIPV